MVRRIVCGCGGEGVGVEEFVGEEALYLGFKYRSQSSQRSQRSVAGNRSSSKTHVHGQRKGNIEFSKLE